MKKTVTVKSPAPPMPPSVVRYYQALGRMTSPAKAKASRENGKLGGPLGGRPRKHPKIELPKSEVLAFVTPAPAPSQPSTAEIIQARLARLKVPKSELMDFLNRGEK